MTAATILGTFNNMMEFEFVTLTCSDGETYTTKMSSPQIAFATAQADNDGEINCVISGRTVTVNAAGMTDVAIGLFIVGYK